MVIAAIPVSSQSMERLNDEESVSDFAVLGTPKGFSRNAGEYTLSHAVVLRRHGSPIAQQPTSDSPTKIGSPGLLCQSFFSTAWRMLSVTRWTFWGSCNPHFGANFATTRNVGLGTGCVLAAESVVTPDVESNCTVAGLPAHKIGERTESIFWTASHLYRALLAGSSLPDPVYPYLKRPEGALRQLRVASRSTAPDQDESATETLYS